MFALACLIAVLGIALGFGACTFLSVEKIHDAQLLASQAAGGQYAAEHVADFHRRFAVLMCGHLDHFASRPDVAAQRRADVRSVLDAYQGYRSAPAPFDPAKVGGVVPVFNRRATDRLSEELAPQCGSGHIGEPLPPVAMPGPNVQPSTLAGRSIRIGAKPSTGPASLD